MATDVCRCIEEANTSAVYLSLMRRRTALTHYKENEMQLEVIDKHGNVRRLRPGESLADGERLHVPYAFMDANALAARDALAAKHGQHTVRDADAEHSTRRRGFVRGFRALDTLLPTRDSQDAAVAYAEKRARLDSARRNIADATHTLAGASTQDARAIADAAYAEKKQRLQGAWRR
jgi:hypothetical protein